MASTTSPMKGLTQLEGTLEEYLVKKAPALPENIKELVVTFAPWLAAIGVIMGIPAVVALFGLGSLVSMMPYGYRYGMHMGSAYMVSTAFFAVALVFQALAIPGLFAKSRKGWQMMFYAMLVSAVSSLVSFNLGGLVIGGIVGMYFLFQVKKLYK